MCACVQRHSRSRFGMTEVHCLKALQDLHCIKAMLASGQGVNEQTSWSLQTKLCTLQMISLSKQQPCARTWQCLTLKGGKEGGAEWDLGVAQGEVGLLEKDVHMHTPYIQLSVPLCWHHMALWNRPVSFTPRLHANPNFNQVLYTPRGEGVSRLTCSNEL